MRRLDSMVREGLKSGVEIGGLLIGSVALDRSKVTVLDVVPVESDYAFGPTFRLSEHDAPGFAEALREHSKKPPRAIGYFRSHLRFRVALRPEDESLMRQFFGGAGCSILLVHPEPDQQSMARFCQWDGVEDARLLDQFLLDTPVTPMEAAPSHFVPLPVRQRVPESPAISSPAAEPETEPSVRRPAPPQERPQPDNRQFRFKHAPIAGAAMLVLFAGIALGRFSGPRKVAGDPALLEITIEAQGSTVKVNWNPSSPALRNSDRGALDFVEGTDFKRIELNREQLRAGHYEYVAAHPDLTCLMTVYRNPNIFIGATLDFHLNLPRNAPLVSVAAQPVDPRQISAAAADVQPPAFYKPGGAIAANQDQKPSTGGTSARATEIPFRTPPVITRPAPAPRVEEPPEIATTGPGSTALPLAASRFPVVPPPAATPPPAVPRVSPTPAPPPSFSEPVVLTKVVPSIPQDLRTQIRRMILVHVAIQIDRDGRVTGAHALDATDRTATLLAPYAIQAARLWRFTPARRDGIAVAGQAVVGFQFGND